VRSNNIKCSAQSILHQENLCSQELVLILSLAQFKLPGWQILKLHPVTNWMWEEDH
jgi:hypothetical protein